MTGVVRWFNARKGFGFVTVDGSPPDGSPSADVFVHRTDLMAAKLLVEGDRVEFEVQDAAKGKRAARVRVLD